MKPLTKTQRDVLQRMVDGYQLVHRVYESCYLIPSGPGSPVTVRVQTLRALTEAGYIATEDGSKARRTYTLTDAGRLALDAPPVGG